MCIRDRLFPLAILTGGPGGSAITESRLNYWLNSPLSDDRDVIIFDQRGIGYSSKLKNLNNDFFAFVDIKIILDLLFLTKSFSKFSYLIILL